MVNVGEYVNAQDLTISAIEDLVPCRILMPYQGLDDLPTAVVQAVECVAETPVDRTDLVEITIFTQAPTVEAETMPVKDMTEQVLARFRDPSLHEVGAGYIDQIGVETGPVYEPFTDSIDVGKIEINLTHRKKF